MTLYLELSEGIEQFWYIMLDDVEIGSFGIEPEGHIFANHISGVEIYEPYRGHGYGQDALKLLFNEWGERPLHLHVHPDNERARHIYEKLGFKYNNNRPYLNYLHMTKE